MAAKLVSGDPGTSGSVPGMHLAPNPGGLIFVRPKSVWGFFSSPPAAHNGQGIGYLAGYGKRRKTHDVNQQGVVVGEK